MASLDDMRHFVRLGAPDAAVVLLSWSRQEQAATVMGLRDGHGVEVSLSRPLRRRLQAVLASPMPTDTVRLAFPEAWPAAEDGPVLLEARVDVPAWTTVVDRTVEEAVNLLHPDSEDVRDALWLLLEAAGAPNGAVRLRRVVAPLRDRAGLEFDPVWVSEFTGGGGRRVDWATVAGMFPPGVDGGHAGHVLAAELAARAEEVAGLMRRPPVRVLLEDVTVAI